MGSNKNCYQDTNCGGHCANSTILHLGLDYRATTSAHCVRDEYPARLGGRFAMRAASAGTKCVFQVLCLPGDCIGDPICTAPLSTSTTARTAIALIP